MAGDARYVRGNYQYQQYVPLNKQYTLAFNGELGWGQGLYDRPFPVFKNFYSGGLGSVRGFDQGTLGPQGRDRLHHRRVRKKITLNAEIITPFPGAGNDRTLRMFGFVDVGNVFGENEKIRFERTARIGGRWAVAGFRRWARCAWRLPIPSRKFAGDRIQNMQFQIGTSF